MLENSVIQHRGFRNTYDESGNATGFQLCVRQLGYRGTWLSQIRFLHVTVDGVKYGPDVVTWNISGIDYTMDEMKNLGRIMWPLKEVATLKVKKPGGLEQGEHLVDARIGHIASYVPPRMDILTDEPHPFQKPTARKLIIV